MPAPGQSKINAVVSVNGRISDAATATVPVFDHGFLYGEGVYETLRTCHGDPFLFDRHMRRLRRSAEMMSLSVPFADDEMLGRVREAMKAHSGGEKYIRILLTRGVGELSYKLDATPAPTLVIIIKALELPPDAWYSDGIKVALVSIRRNHPQALNPMIKSNNLLNLALAMQEAYRRGADEALMQNQSGEIVECSQSNFFLVRGGRVMTPPLTAGLLPGITREYVLELAAELKIPAAEARLTPADLETADEAFLTGTTRDIVPIVKVDDCAIGAGRPGQTTRRLLQYFREKVAALATAR